MKYFHGADITSADYIYLEPHGTIFYDTWVNKDIAGKPFWNTCLSCNMKRLGGDTKIWNRFKFLLRGQEGW